MSAYKNYVEDFPKRCLLLLDFYKAAAEKKDLHVTLLLSVAAQAIIIPWERLELGTPRQSHPSQDAEKFKTDSEKLKAELDLVCQKSDAVSISGSSQLFNPCSEWTYSECDLEQANSEIHKPKGSISGKKRATILKILRNSLAHGNWRTNGNPIDRIIFLSSVSEYSPKYNRLECSPATFENFLRGWIAKLSKLDFRPYNIVEAKESFSRDEPKQEAA